MELKEKIKLQRIEKIKRLERKRIDPYPIFSKRTHSISQVLRNFSKLKNRQLTIVGRMRSRRIHGKITFFDLEDQTGKIQILLREKGVGEKAYQFFLKEFDIGDFLQVEGQPFITKTREKSIDLLDFKILAKSLLPLPEKWHGLKDIEERYRRRYLDLIFNKQIREKFSLKSRIISELRRFLEKNGFLEIETPILQSIYGGARARPFKTHLNALNLDLYLRISPELYLKRLLVGGFEKVYELGKVFRNEGIDKFHNPEFIILEFYWAYADYKKLMKFTEEMFGYLLKKIFKRLEITYQGEKIDFTPPWPRLEFRDLFQKELKIDYDTLAFAGFKEKAKEFGIEVERGETKVEIADKIFKKKIREKLKNPTFVIHWPVGFQPLAKRKDEKRLANFQLFVGGIELVNAFSELNDPQEQEERFKEQEKLFKKGLKEAQRMDKDFILALEYGMPPAGGWGMGVDRLAMILTNSTNLREIIPFPTMRPKND